MKVHNGGRSEKQVTRVVAIRECHQGFRNVFHSTEWLWCRDTVIRGPQWFHHFWIFGSGACLPNFLYDCKRSCSIQCPILGILHPEWRSRFWEQKFRHNFISRASNIDFNWRFSKRPVSLPQPIKDQQIPDQCRINFWLALIFTRENAPYTAQFVRRATCPHLSLD